ncbi:MAG: heme o synthase [Acidobacteria bacterium]|nr:heme o synthase [Acidobacteriota bacterium]
MKSVAASIAAAPHRAADFVALTKPRLNSLVVVSAGVGYVLGAGAAPDLGVALHALIGCGLVAGSAAAFNQVAERDVDKAMRRTERRPLAAGRITPAEGTVFAGLVGAAGLAELALGANVLAALVALVTLVCYAGIYTPLKRRTAWATLVGAVPGALPPVIGWAAARGALTVEAAVLFGIVFLWQLPHFHALAWLYRDDYARAGLPLVATGDPDGRRTAAHAAAYAAALVPMSLTPALVGLVGPGHLAVAGALGALLLIPALRFRRQRDDRRARALFVASLAYLPLLWISLVLGNVRG